MQGFVTGPVRLWVAFPTGAGVGANGVTATGTPQPFATCERAPQVIESTEYKPWINDLGGEVKPFDFVHQGTDAIVAGLANRFRYPVYKALSETPRFAAAGILGDSPGDVGTLMAQEGRCCTLFVEYIYGGSFPKPSHIAGGMPAGRRFIGAVWQGPTRSQPGTMPLSIAFVFYCLRVYNPTTGAMMCADENMAPIAGLPWEVAP